ncbi:HisA/HisF-related TIM barrel protein [Methylocystis sp. IM3]|uniref:HisA/HisF-related TIM barrel protein n=1 Tax=unclassified Methylocystis TaxID=2625913 RepID=UPI0030FA370F
MEIVPVIDIRKGAAVRAVAGRRADYRPLATPLSPTSDPPDVARGLMALHPFGALYIADLDAIEGRGNNLAAIAEVAETIAPARVWLDGGFREARQSGATLPANVDVVLGSETLARVEDAALQEDRSRFILSLDFTETGFLGDPRLLSDVSLWPERVVVMTLARVGVGKGPDLPRLRDIAMRAQGRRVYAAGGVRSLDDLRALEQAGVAGALVATALHDGRLSAATLARMGAK